MLFGGIEPDHQFHHCGRWNTELFATAARLRSLHGNLPLDEPESR
jgi:hypothetical protein